MDELAIDETQSDSIAKIRAEVYFELRDSLTQQLQNCFPESSLNIVTQMTYFSHEGLLSVAESMGGTLNPILVSDLCEYYGSSVKNFVKKLICLVNCTR